MLNLDNTSGHGSEGIVFNNISGGAKSKVLGKFEYKLDGIVWGTTEFFYSSRSKLKYELTLGIRDQNHIIKHKSLVITPEKVAFSLLRDVNKPPIEILTLTEKGANFIGDVSANRYYGDGSNLTGIKGIWIKSGSAVYVNNNVGIGTTSPQSELHVHGDGRIDDNLHVGSILNINGWDSGLNKGNARLQMYVNNDIGYFRTLGSEKHRMVFHMADDNNDGQSYIQFSDDANGGWFKIFNNKKVQLQGELIVDGKIWATERLFKNLCQMK